MDALWKVPEVPSLIKIGEVSSIDPAKCTARVVFDDEDGLVSYDLPILQRNSLKNHDFAMLDVGEDAIVLFFGEGQEDGVILGSIYAGEVTPPESTENRRTVVFDDDTRVCYDRQEHKLTVTIEGTEIVSTARTAPSRCRMPSRSTAQLRRSMRRRASRLTRRKRTLLVC